jgi:3-oxoacyl-[acyl-carrier-protein] synthase III
VDAAGTVVDGAGALVVGSTDDEVLVPATDVGATEPSGRAEVVVATPEEPPPPHEAASDARATAVRRRRRITQS